ncbi:formamidopyrimidine-DNA glycosylase [Pseudoclavibacter endophyticus]|uniref:DNA-(apurinic or apyrimidinic site) lyase n=1 Tax=Pseudoclavibacter endophyticus TaxID=1778590 RepID=A0A6H9WGK6_9MICO|nr:DNA-formamidopyrimidine glycosylase family protein [Pseudoclavibacter endophyticus]KAB1646731.1 Fpg/Nei family DNA glycosylase [Pseudoclavibacter endophyticus]GGA76036.1 formamidopyrimidine-DNA glycosylase [Pseudoclavibacter endophyticus]
MPEGHSVHRIARQFEANFAGRTVSASSPQGRFTVGAAEIDGRRMLRTFAVGKQMFAEFEGDAWLRVHLGMYGAWDFAGDVSTTLGQTGEYSTRRPQVRIEDSRGETSLSSIGAPRRTRLRMAEGEQESELTAWPPEPVGAVRLRLLTDATCADLRGPTACELLDAAAVERHLAKLGPDPLVDRGRAAEERFVSRVAGKRTPIGILLMDQSVVAGIGNVYRAEILFRAGIDPHRPGSSLSEDTARGLWRDWAKLLKIGVEVGQMMTIDGLRGKRKADALRNRDDRHWVYGRAGLPCRVCGTTVALEEMQARKLYWCPGCQH